MAGHNQMRVVEIGAQFSSDSVARVANEPVKSRLTVFNLASVSRIDWMALAMLADCRSRVRAKGGDLALAGVGPKLRDALRRLGIQEAVPVYDTVEAARLALSFGFAR